jgi:hypothetical protein
MCWHIQARCMQRGPTTTRRTPQSTLTQQRWRLAAIQCWLPSPPCLSLSLTGPLSTLCGLPMSPLPVGPHPMTPLSPALQGGHCPPPLPPPSPLLSHCSGALLTSSSMSCPAGGSARSSSPRRGTSAPSSQLRCWCSRTPRAGSSSAPTTPGSSSVARRGRAATTCCSTAGSREACKWPQAALWQVEGGGAGGKGRMEHRQGYCQTQSSLN